MDSQITRARSDLFLILDAARSRLAYFTDALGPIERRLATATVGVDVYFAASTGIALLGLRLNRRKLTLAELRWAIEQAEAIGAPVLDPSRLDEGDRRAFYGSYLDGYDVRARNLCGPRAALSELARQLGLRRQRAHTSDPLQCVATVRDERPPELDRTPPPATVPPQPSSAPPAMPDSLQSRRLGSAPPGIPHAAEVPDGRTPRGKLAPTHRSPRQRQQFALVEQAAMARSEALRRATTVRYPLERASPSAARVTCPDRPRGKGKQRQRTPTLPETPIAKATSAKKEHEHESTKQGPPPLPRPRAAHAERRVADGSGSNPILDEGDAVTPTIAVRYQRGGEWVHARLRSLSLKGAYLVAGALPPKGARARIELSFAGAVCAIPGNVYHVTTVDDAVDTGSAGFALRFSPADTPARRQLILLLKRARAAGVTIKPPPERAAVRFPVNWPIRVGIAGGAVRADALDVSTGGLFVATSADFRNRDLVFRLPLDNGEAPICGRARVARIVSKGMARERGLHAGYGLEIIGLSEADVPRYESFLHRIRQRIEHRVLVAAAPGRMRQLMSAFTAAGYTVTGGSEANTVLQLAGSQDQAPHAAVIDASLSAKGMDKNRLAHAFASRGVPCVPCDNEPPTLTRAVVDRLLGVNA